MTEIAGQRFRLYNTQDLEAVIARMARQTLALLDPAQRPVVVGVLRRGAPLADRLVAAIAELSPRFAVDRLDALPARLAQGVVRVAVGPHRTRPVQRERG